MNSTVFAQHCISIEESRWLHEDAVRSYVQDTLIVEQGKRITLLQQQNNTLFNDFNERLTIANQKFNKQVEVTMYEQLQKESFKSESEYNRKRFKKERLKKWGTVILGVVIGAAGGYVAGSL